jgi:CRP/FNR family transcriptional regulator
MQTMREAVGNSMSHAHRAGGFLNKLSPEALMDLESLECPLSYPAGMALFSEKDAAKDVFVVLSGEVKLSINSGEGKRLILRIAKAGEILGLTSTVNGTPHDVTAETFYPARIAPIERPEFLGFLVRHPEVYQTVTEELSAQLTMACEQLRTVGLSSSAPEKLARLLLDWSESGQKTDCGMKFRFSLTHEEVGEFIGASRETVTRTLSNFKSRRLVAFHGSTATIPSRVALESYARCYDIVTSR